MDNVAESAAEPENSAVKSEKSAVLSVESAALFWFSPASRQRLPQRSLPKGVDALIFSIMAAWLLWRIIVMKRDNMKNRGNKT